MINPFQEINWRPTDKDMERFGKVIFAGAVVVALGCFWLSGGAGVLGPYLILFIGFAVFFLAMLAPRAALPFYYLWFFLSACIGTVVANLLMLLFFYLVFTPFAWAARTISGRDPLHLKKNPAANSYWVEKTAEPELKRYLKQY